MCGADVEERWGGGGVPGREAMGSCSPVEVEVAGLGWRAELVRKGVGEVCVGGSRVGGKGCVFVCVGGGGFSRIDQALEEADCATFEDEGTIMLLGSVSRRRGSQTTRGKAL